MVTFIFLTHTYVKVMKTTLSVTLFSISYQTYKKIIKSLFKFIQIHLIFYQKISKEKNEECNFIL